MKAKLTPGEYLLKELTKRYEVTALDVGADRNLDKGMMHFGVRSYNVEGIGHYCLLTMRGMLGLMKMETAVLAADKKDVPLFNMDTVTAMGKTTGMAELYETRLAAGDGALEAACEPLKAADEDLEAYASGPHWYDSMLMSCSYAKKEKGKGERTAETLRKYANAFLEELDRAPACDPEAKREKNRALPQGLLDHGGPAVDPVKKMFGEETAKRLLLTHMYGVE